MTECILSEYRNDKCANCTPYCPHRIAMMGLDGNGGRVSSAGLPKDYRDVTLANSPVRASQPDIYALLDEYVKTFGREGRIKSLYMWSDSPGTGKTTSASAVLNNWIAHDYLSSLKAGKHPRQQPAYFLDVNAWQELYTGFTRPNIPQDIAEKNSRPYYDQMEKAKRAPFAVLDDIGVRGKASDGFRGDLHTVINHRTSNGMPTIFTSNLTIKEMAKVFDDRLYDRIRDQAGVIHFKGGSKRGRR